MAYLSLSLTTDWGLSNTIAGEFGNSAAEFTRRRWAQAASLEAANSTSSGGGAAGGGAASAPASPMKRLSPSKRLARDCVILKALDPPRVPGMASSLPSSPGFKFDAERYAKYEKQKALLGPRERSEAIIPL